MCTKPMVIRHPVSGRMAIYAGGSVPWRIAGMDEAPQCSTGDLRPGILPIMPQYVYRHQWQPGESHHLGQSQRDASRDPLMTNCVTGA